MKVEWDPNRYLLNLTSETVLVVSASESEPAMIRKRTAMTSGVSRIKMSAEEFLNFQCLLQVQYHVDNIPDGIKLGNEQSFSDGIEDEGCLGAVLRTRWPGCTI